MIDYDELRWTLKTRRTELGLTQADVGAKMGCAPHYVSMLETGAAASPKITTLKRWCESLGGFLRVDVEFEAPATDGGLCRMVHPTGSPLPRCRCEVWEACELTSESSCS